MNRSNVTPRPQWDASRPGTAEVAPRKSESTIDGGVAGDQLVVDSIKTARERVVYLIDYSLVSLILSQCLPMRFERMIALTKSKLG